MGGCRKRDALGVVGFGRHLPPAAAQKAKVQQYAYLRGFLPITNLVPPVVPSVLPLPAILMLGRSSLQPLAPAPPFLAVLLFVETSPTSLPWQEPFACPPLAMQREIGECIPITGSGILFCGAYNLAPVLGHAFPFP